MSFSRNKRIFLFIIFFREENTCDDKLANFGFSTLIFTWWDYLFLDILRKTFFVTNLVFLFFLVLFRLWFCLLIALTHCTVFFFFIVILSHWVFMVKFLMRQLLPLNCFLDFLPHPSKFYYLFLLLFNTPSVSQLLSL